MISSSKAFQFSQVFRQLSLLIVNVLLTKNLLSTAQIGDYEWLWYSSAALTFSWTSGIIQYASSIYNQEDERFLSNVFGLMQGLMLLCFFFVCVLQPNKESWLLFFSFQLFNIPSILLEYILYWKNKTNHLLQISLWSNLVTILCLSLPLYLNYNISTSYSFLIVVGIVRWLILLYELKPIYLPQIKSTILLLQKSAPLIFYALLGSFSIILDGWLLEYFFKDSTLFAQFRYGAKEMPTVLTLSAAFSAALIPILSQQKTEGLEELKTRSAKLFPVFFIPAMILMVFSQPIFTLIFNKDFATSAPIFNIYLLITLSRAIFSQTILVALGHHRLQVKIGLVEIAINIVVSLVLIPFLGIAGIAWGTFVAFLSEKIIQTLWLWKNERILPTQFIHWTYWFYAIGLIICFIASLFL